MPGNHTEHYELSQWERSDQVLMEDFNEDNRRIDAALKAEADANAALSASLTSEIQTRTALSGAVAKLGNCQVYITTYTGNGAKSRTITFPGYPVYVYIRYPSYSTGITFMRGLDRDDASTYSAQWSSRGLSLSTTGTNYNFNNNNAEYYMFALLDMSK